MPYTACGLQLVFGFRVLCMLRVHTGMWQNLLRVCGCACNRQRMQQRWVLESAIFSSLAPWALLGVMCLTDLGVAIKHHAHTCDAAVGANVWLT
jgi:hypothetical protein